MAEKEYIPREAALQFVFDACAECMDACEEFDGIYADCNQCMLEGVKLKLRDLPAADVRPVVKAAWEQVEVRYEDELIDNPVQAVASMFCPNCQRYHNEVYFYGMPTERVNYCPNCGADMRKES